MNRVLIGGLKVIGGLLLVLVLVVAAGTGTIVYQRWSGIREGREAMGPPAGVLHVDGMTFRDLNKNGRLDSYEDRRLPVEARVEDLLARMTPEEKAGMLFQQWVFPGKDGQIAGPWNPMNFYPAEREILVNKLNSFNLMSMGSPEEAARWLNDLQRLAERSRLGIPLTISSDPRHTATSTVASFAQGGFSRWPEQIGLGALRSEAVTERFGQIAAREYRAVGIHVALHPQVDLATEPRWGRIMATFGEDANLTARLATAYIRGFQGRDLGPTSVATVTKHFAGGGPQLDGWDPHFRLGKDQVYPGRNFAYHLIPFRAAIAAGTTQIMPYYGVPVGITGKDVGFNFDKKLLTGVLRDKMGFKGIILSDWTILTPPKLLGIELKHLSPIMDAKNYGVEALGPAGAALKAVDAGVNQFGGESRPAYILDALQNGKLSMARVDQSVRLILALKFRLGLFDDPYVDVATVRERVGTPRAVALGLAAQRASQVLLTNKPVRDAAGAAPILPLARGTRIFVQGIDRAVAARYGTVVDKVEDADVAIINLPPPFDHDAPTPGFMHQGRLYYTSEELKPMLDVAAKKPTVVTVMLERPFVIPEIAKASRAVLANFGASDDAILAVVFGRAAPRGKLPFDMPSTWSSVLKQKPDVPFDLQNPLFRFGEGLTYRR